MTDYFRLLSNHKCWLLFRSPNSADWATLIFFPYYMYNSLAEDFFPSQTRALITRLVSFPDANLEAPLVESSIWN
jgi:hypothetical protein